MTTTTSDFRARIDFEKALHVGQRVEVRWTCGSFGHYKGLGTVAKINAASVRVALDQPVTGWEGRGGWPAGFEIVAPFEFNHKNGSIVKTWAHFNGVFPLPEQA